jgi:hypothetical protein
MFPKKFIEETIEGMPGGVLLILIKGIHQHADELLNFVG